MRYSFVTAGLLVIGLSSAPGAHAEERTGIYVGTSIGEATNEVEEFKGSDTAFKLYGGYAFNDYFGVEVAYVDAGTQSDNVGPLHIENESSGIIASALVHLPIGERFSLFGKLGYAFYDAASKARLGDRVVSESESDEDLTYGVGLELAVAGGLGLRAEYEVIDVSEGDFDVVSAGVLYRC
jgi:OOP family OmpA-OmpF porin